MSISPREDMWKARNDPLYRPQTMAGWHEWHERNKLPNYPISDFGGASRAPAKAKPTPSELAAKLCDRELSIINKERRRFEREKRRTGDTDAWQSRGRLLEARQKRYELAYSQVEKEPRKVVETLRMKSVDGISLPRGAQYTDPSNVSISSLSFAIVVTYGLSRFNGWRLNDDPMNLLITFAVATIIGFVFFHSRLALARRITIVIVLLSLLGAAGYALMRVR